MTDIVIKSTSKIWYEDLFPGDYRVISKNEAKKICRDSRKAGMIQAIDRHMYFKNSQNHFVICNCCKESCVPLIAYRLFKDEPFSWLQPRSVAAVSLKKCRGCGECIAACPFEERVLRGEGKRKHAAVLNCMGCGICVDACPNGANRMVSNIKAAV
jgi:ferredoxin